MLSALAAAVLWGATLALTRMGVVGTDGLGPADLALLRFLLPALVLAPALRGLRLPRPVSLFALLAGGVPFVLLAAAGLRHAPAAAAGAVLPGAFPLCVAAIGMALGRERPSLMRCAGLLVIAASVLAVAAPALADGASQGYLLLLAAAAVSAAQTVAMRASGLAPLKTTALIGAGSLACFLPVYTLACPPRLMQVEAAELLVHLLVQGGLAGLASPLLFASAVARLGASRAASFGGLTPFMAALFGALVLGEIPPPDTVLAGLGAGAGIVLANRAPNSGGRVAPPAAIGNAGGFARLGQVR